MKIAVLFHRLGPYHFARLKAASALCELHAIEFSSVDDTYAWDVVEEKIIFARTTLFTNHDVAKKTTFEIMQALKNVFTLINPDVVAIPGWSGRPAFLALALCRKTGIPAIAMADSTEEHDQVRRWWKEWIKKRVAWNFTAGLVGGRPHAEYMHKLGVSSDRIFTGYDVVDNNYFALEASNARKNAEELRANYALPENYFLASNRFITKKNIDGLIRAYGAYRARVGQHGWKLVLLGDGELRPQIEGLISKLDLGADVLLPGFKQYPDLPVYYGLANVYVQASTSEQWGLVVNEAMASGLPVLLSNRCGCAPDLVREGENGFTFDPYDVSQLTDLLVNISSNDFNRKAMEKRAKESFLPGPPNICRKSASCG